MKETRRRAYKTRPLHPTGKLIKQLRKASGFTQKELQEKLGFKTSSSISKIESRDFIPQLDTLKHFISLLQPTAKQRNEILHYFNVQETDFLPAQQFSIPYSCTEIENKLIQLSAQLLQASSFKPLAGEKELYAIDKTVLRQQRIYLSYQALLQACLLAENYEIQNEVNLESVNTQFEIAYALLNAQEDPKLAFVNDMSAMCLSFHVCLLWALFKQISGQKQMDFTILNTHLCALKEPVFQRYELHLGLLLNVKFAHLSSQLEQLSFTQMQVIAETNISWAEFNHNPFTTLTPKLRILQNDAREILSALPAQFQTTFFHHNRLHLFIARIHAWLGNEAQAQEIYYLIDFSKLNAVQHLESQWVQWELQICREWHKKTDSEEVWLPLFSQVLDFWPEKRIERRLFGHYLRCLPFQTLFWRSQQKKNAQWLRPELAEITSTFPQLWYNNSQDDTR